MELTPLLIYESFILSVGVAAVLAFALFYFRLLRGYHELANQHKKLQEEVRSQSNQVMSQTQDEAVRILAQSKALSNDVRNELVRLLEQTAKSEAKEYDEMMTQVEHTITQTSQKELRDFTQELGKEAKDASHQLESQMNDAYAQAKQEIEKYKAQQFAKVDQAMYDILAQVIVKTSGVMLSKQDHEGIARTTLKEVKDAHLL